MVRALSKATFSLLAGSTTLKRVASRYGMREPHSFARRFVAGETLPEAIEAARAIERQGMHVTLDFLGERVTARDAAATATRAYVDLVGAVAAAGISRNLSLKLTQLGLDIDRATTIDNLRHVVDVAAEADTFVRIDMEESSHIDQTFDVFETLWGIGFRNMGLVVQAYLRHSGDYVRRMNALGARVRLVKGAYREPTEVAFQEKSEVDAQFLTLMKELLEHGVSPAIATHDDVMIEAVRTFAAEKHIDKDKFELQMLYGVRRDLQRSLTAGGYQFRVYVPFGKEWFPYFMRRLGERPANVGFVVKSLFREQP
jgi:proline dehydrogenase